MDPAGTESAELRCFPLIRAALNAKAAENGHVARFAELLDREFTRFCDREPARNDVRPYRLLHGILEELRSVSAVPRLFNRRVCALGGAFSSGKSAFINSFLRKDAGLSLAEGILPVTAIPSRIICDNEIQKAVVKGVSAKGGVFDFPGDLYQNLSHELLRSLGFNLTDILRHIVVFSPMQEGLFEHLCIMDTPGYNPPRLGTEENDEETARKALDEADFLIWLVGLDVTGTLTRTDLDFLEQLDFGREEGKPLYIVASKADLIPEESVEEILDGMQKELENSHLRFEGISAYSAKFRQKLISWRKKNIYQFLRENNRPLSLYDRFRRELSAAFLEYYHHILDDSRQEAELGRLIKVMRLEAMKGDDLLSGSDHPLSAGLAELERNFSAGRRKKEDRLADVKGLHLGFLSCLADFCAGVGLKPAGRGGRGPSSPAQPREKAPEHPRVREFRRAVLTSRDLWKTHVFSGLAAFCEEPWKFSSGLLKNPDAALLEDMTVCRRLMGVCGEMQRMIVFPELLSLRMCAVCGPSIPVRAAFLESFLQTEDDDALPDAVRLLNFLPAYVLCHPAVRQTEILGFSRSLGRLDLTGKESAGFFRDSLQAFSFSVREELRCVFVRRPFPREFLSQLCLVLPPDCPVIGADPSGPDFEAGADCVSRSDTLVWVTFPRPDRFHEETDFLRGYCAGGKGSRALYVVLWLKDEAGAEEAREKLEEIALSLEKAGVDCQGLSAWNSMCGGVPLVSRGMDLPRFLGERNWKNFSEMELGPEEKSILACHQDTDKRLRSILTGFCQELLPEENQGREPYGSRSSEPQAPGKKFSLLSGWRTSGGRGVEKDRKEAGSAANGGEKPGKGAGILKKTARDFLDGFIGKKKEKDQQSAGKKQAGIISRITGMLRGDRKPVYEVSVLRELCLDCGDCRRICPAHVFVPGNGRSVPEKSGDCFGCLACVDVCCQKAVTVVEKTSGKKS